MKKIVKVITGNLIQIPADAIITAINSGGMWFGGIDGAIQHVAGSFFHDQAMRALPLKHGEVVVAGPRYRDSVMPKNVVFVIDDLTGPLSNIVFNGLVASHKEGFKSVTLPTIRMGVMLGVVEKSKEEAVREMVAGVARFLDETSTTSIKSITFVVYTDPDTHKLLEKTIETMLVART